MASLMFFGLVRVTDGVLLRSWLFDLDSSKGVVFMLGEWLGRIVGDCCMNGLIDEYEGMMKRILLDHPLSYALTATADVHVVYLQQFWRTVSKVPGPEDTIKFMLNTQEFVYTMDMVGYQGVVDKVSAFHTKNLAQQGQTKFKVFSLYLNTRISRHDQTKIIILQMFHVVINRTNVDYAALLWIIEDYHSIKDDIPLVSVYTTGNVLVQGMLILDAFLTVEIRATDDFKEYKTVFMNVDVPMNQPKLFVSTQRTHRSIPRTHRTPTLISSPKGKKRKQSA
nr:hypothetical protein [Tanacetum cinerariifolium]